MQHAIERGERPGEKPIGVGRKKIFETRWVNPVVSSCKSICVCLCSALAPFPLLFRCCFSWRNANLGDLRVVWLFVVLVLCGWCSVWICPHLKETIVFRIEFLSQVTCLYEFQDRALERYRPYQKKKKSAAAMGFETCSNCLKATRREREIES